MRTFRKGKHLDIYRIEGVVSRQPGRIEYSVVPTESKLEGEYHLIAYDLDEFPVEYLWTWEDGGSAGRPVPFERQFLQLRPFPAFPLFFADGVDGEIQWIVVKRKPGPTVREYVKQKGAMPVRLALKTAMELCSVVEVIDLFEDNKAGHFNITPDTVRIIDDDELPELFIDGFGHSSVLRPECEFSRPIDESSFYLAPELFIGYPSSRSDVFGVCMILYMLLTGKDYPWSLKSLPLYDKVLSGRCGRDAFVVGMGHLWNESPDLTEVHPRQLKTVIYNGIATNPNKRTEDVVELQLQLENVMSLSEESFSETVTGGFASVAGMTEVKRQMMRKFVLPIRNKKLADAYKISPPSGCLLYGAPGCGKTFFVEKLGAEAGIPVSIFRPSDIASIYVHGGQEKIRELFDEARKEAPVIICFDEADAFVSNRKMHGNESYAGEVNEFLVQLNNLAKTDGVYVILATNSPESLDPAVLRTGRVDEKFYVPMPDREAREEFFRIRFRDVPVAGDLDYSRLTSLTEGMTFSDLDYVVAEACREKFLESLAADSRRVMPLTEKVLEEVIAEAPRSVSVEEALRYEAIRDRFERNRRERSRRKIGYM